MLKLIIPMCCYMFSRLLILAICIPLSCWAARSPEASGSTREVTLLIAHAMGAYDGRTYLNCREAFYANYARGYRYFEVDMMHTSDGSLVCLHNDIEAAMGLPRPFTKAQFTAGKLAGKYTGLTVEDLVDLMVEKTDWFLVTDIKDDFSAGLATLLKVADARSVDSRKRIIPQIYFESQLPHCQTLPFESYILTMYLMGPDFAQAERMLASEPKFCALTMPHEYATPAILDRFRVLNVAIFVHTVNDPKLSQFFLTQGVGIYTDSYTPDFSMASTR